MLRRTTLRKESDTYTFTFSTEIDAVKVKAAVLSQEFNFGCAFSFFHVPSSLQKPSMLTLRKESDTDTFTFFIEIGPVEDAVLSQESHVRCTFIHSPSLPKARRVRLTC